MLLDMYYGSLRGEQDSTPLLGENAESRNTSESQPLWKKEACILAAVASGMAIIAGLLGAYALFMHNDHNGVGDSSTISPSRRLRLHVSAVSVTAKLMPKEGRHEVPASKQEIRTDQKGFDTEDEGRENESDMNRRFLTGQDDLYDHVHTAIGYFDGREQGL